MASKVATAAAATARRPPSIVREIFYGLALGLSVASCWKMYHISYKRRVREFYEALERGEITTVIKKVEEVPIEKVMELLEEN
ncbi:putative cytochrome c oxidase subunit 5C-4 [Selaginella moellendorffii]|uniref:putative cytochrome c oxidase subunit 5C-4 n=1 Tax=Selaginella moellendorffii TaxID=88036 RepID=UPI000D1C30EC|nr:putative cytochrome c oxidase subunit 5C-4 [Selaginella moellendorffii]XP_024544470.1 putative cytochrome c oxidase subunit 5C-4 [Selaginella moellendorffii]|eukprot:XP_024543589.1 putative cytochrome c oxidase subunit 5C-4 [Selaginella moellendorffii]